MVPNIKKSGFVSHETSHHCVFYWKLTPLTDKGSGSSTKKKHTSSICGQWFSSGSV